MEPELTVSFEVNCHSECGRVRGCAERNRDIQLYELFVPTHSVAEMVVRGTWMYLGLFLKQAEQLSAPTLRPADVFSTISARR